MGSSARVALFVVAGSLLGGCGQTLPLDVIFAGQEHLDRTEQLALFVVPATDEVTCDTLRTQAELQNIADPVLQVALRSVCEFDGAISIDNLPSGPHYFVMYGVDASNAVVVTGCIERDVFADASPLTITLVGTDDAVRSGVDAPMRTCR